MPQLIWDAAGDKTFERGLNRGVLYPPNGDGVVWNGLISVNENASNTSATAYYVDGVKYYQQPGVKEFGASIEAYTYPEEFEVLEGFSDDSKGISFDQQGAEEFGLSYCTQMGDDLDHDRGYKIHLIYNAMVDKSDRNHKSNSDQTDPNNFRWDIVTRPILVPGLKPSSHVIIKSTKTHKDLLEELEFILYGSETTPARMPSVEELVTLFSREWYQVIPAEGTGLAQLLVNNDDSDLRSDDEPGLNIATLVTRLTPSSTPGLYTLEG